MKTKGALSGVEAFGTARRTSRREFLKLGGADLVAGLAGTALFGVAGCGGRSRGGEGSSDGRLVEHALGETRMPGEPGRVVALDSFIGSRRCSTRAFRWSARCR